MKILICGGRGYSNREYVYKILDRIHEVYVISEIIHGDAKGADTLGKEWAIDRGLEHNPFPADWSQFGRAAGPIRNKQMLDVGKPHIVVAFPGGKGTANMVQLSLKYKIKVLDLRTGDTNVSY